MSSEYDGSVTAGLFDFWYDLDVGSLSQKIRAAWDRLNSPITMIALCVSRVTPMLEYVSFTLRRLRDSALLTLP
jgi:hypothetical protein